jgi:dephospho-CoA kinase
MAIVFITGMSGVGKSTLLRELADRGYDVVDTDAVGLVLEVTDSEGAVVDHVWDEPCVTTLLDAVAERPLFVAGCVSNQGLFYDRFAAVVLLSVQRDVLLQRLETRTSNSFGKAAAERAAIIADLESVEPLLRQHATVELDGSAPIATLADQVQALA